MSTKNFFKSLSREEQVIELDKELAKDLIQGQRMCLLSLDWIEQFRSGEKDITIDNSSIVETRGERLKPNMKENVDFQSVSEQFYEQLKEQFGGGPKITRLIQKLLIGRDICKLKRVILCM
ncbi:MAG: hypothetical protein EZS28_015264 [Streblomastix strix]|uniref:DUSP domain-containing protein n=1 Tax=Streblomastix strix TaxID=222440 RepID=A0A5J4W2Z9_9EUKA|nr:MAG: hypothetical protein EZS28_015264 [Streblomastix strix]